MSTTDRIRQQVGNCLRSPDANLEGDFASIATLAKMCREGCSMQVLEVMKQPFKNGTAPGGQLRMAHLLEQLMSNASWPFRSNLASEKWMSRVLEVARNTRDESLRQKLCQLVVDWAALYGQDPSLYGLREFGAARLASQGLPTPTPSISPTLSLDAGLARGIPSPQQGGGGGAARSPPRVTPPLSSSSSLDRAALSRQPSSSGIRYGVKTAAPGSGAVQPSSPPAPAVRHRDASADVDNGVPDLDLFLCNVDADIEALNLGLQRVDLVDELPALVAQLKDNRKRINDYLARDCDSDTNTRLITMFTNLEESIECYQAMQEDGLYSDPGEDDDGMPPRQPTIDLSNNPTAERLGLTSPSARAMTGATSEIERLRAELKRSQENEARLQRELDETKMEKESLKAQLSAGGGAAAAGRGGAGSPAVVAALKAFLAKSKIVIQSCRDSQMEVVRAVEESQNYFKPNFKKCINAMGQLAHRPNNESLIKKLQTDYLKEMKLRKEYFNQIQELRGNIRVYCRVRPLSQKEKEQHKATNITKYPGEDDIVIHNESKRTDKRYEFDRVYQPGESQETVFVDTSPLIESVIDGYNVTVFAYGQTGSGKTYTMEGSPENPGVYTRALKRLFQIIEDKKDDEEVSVTLSILEIYNEQIRDLLVSKSTTASTEYEVKTGGETGNYISNLSEQHVTTIEDIDKWSAVAHKHRASAPTGMNADSSRSHMLLYFVVKTRNIATGTSSYGKLSLIDLAGSERISKSGVEGQAKKEAQCINKSLSALGNTISALSSGAKYVPYRDSKLTYLLMDSLSGNSKVLMFANISPADYNVSETGTTLDFAARARNTALGQAKKNK